MTKADIVNQISKNTGVDKTSVLATVEAFMEIVKDSLSKEENVYLRGFGSFTVKKSAQRKLLATFLRILRSSFQPATFPLLSRLKNL